MIGHIDCNVAIDNQSAVGAIAAAVDLGAGGAGEEEGGEEGE